jgi:ABC-type enterochelin transport system permease subunit
MDAINTVKSWIGALTDVFLMLLGLAIVCAMLVGTGNLPFFGNVVSNIMGLVGDLGKNGLVGLIALGIILWLFANRKMA